MTNSGSEGLSPVSEHEPRVVALDGAPRRYVIDATLDVSHETAAEELVQLYWSVQALQPAVVDVDDEWLSARFRRHAPSAEVAAWALADELRALPGARVTRVEVRPASGGGTEFVLAKTADITMFSTAEEVAA